MRNEYNSSIDHQVNFLNNTSSFVFAHILSNIYDAFRNYSRFLEIRNYSYVFNKSTIHSHEEFLSLDFT